jgi:hypothetical protein
VKSQINKLLTVECTVLGWSTSRSSKGAGTVLFPNVGSVHFVKTLPSLLRILAHSACLLCQLKCLIKTKTTF